MSFLKSLGLERVRNGVVSFKVQPDIQRVAYSRPDDEGLTGRVKVKRRTNQPGISACLAGTEVKRRNKVVRKLSKQEKISVQGERVGW